MKIQGIEISDAALRASEAVNAAILAGGTGRWLAIRLSDGSSDGNIYDSLVAARKHQMHVTQSAYCCLPADMMPPQEAQLWLDVHRKMYDKGFVVSDPDSNIQTAPFGGAIETPRNFL